MTNLGPLTTTFTPSGDDCSSTFIGSVHGNEWIQYGVAATASSACLPPYFNAYQPHYYSPGICPSGYTSACTAQVSVSSMPALETEVTCCPSSYSCHEDRSDDPFGCVSYFSGTRTFAVSKFFFETDSAGITTKINSETTTEVSLNNWILAYGPVVRRAASGISNVTSPASSSPTDSWSDRVTSTATAAISTVTGENGKITGHLGTGAAAGIGVGVGIAALILIVVMVVLFRRRRIRLGVHDETISAEQTSQVHGSSMSEQGYMPWSEYQQQQQKPKQQQEQPETVGHELIVERENVYELNSERD